MSDKLDEKDFTLLGALRKNSRLSEKKLAKATGIPMTTVHNRIKKMKQDGVIENFTIRANYAKLGKPLTAYVMLKAVNQADQKGIFEMVKKIPGVFEAALITGEFDLIFKAKVADMQELNSLVVQNLRKHRGIGESRTMLCYETCEAL